MKLPHLIVLLLVDLIGVQKSNLSFSPTLLRIQGFLKKNILRCAALRSDGTHSRSGSFQIICKLVEASSSSSGRDFLLLNWRRDGIVVRASDLQSVDLGFIPLVESHQKTFKNGIHSFPAWHLAFMGGCGEQAGKFSCVLVQDT